MAILQNGVVISGGSSTAKDSSYDNSLSHLEATNVNAAIDEVVGMLDDVQVTKEAVETALGYTPASEDDIPTNVSELNNDAGYLTEHQDISGKVDKETGKSLISDTEITRLANVDNYDDTALSGRVTTLEGAGYITKSVSDLTNYYTKTDTYTQDEVDELISLIPKFDIEVVASLPTKDISTTTIYLVKTSDTETGNLYTEYIYVNSTWEKLGTQTLDLSGYQLKSTAVTHTESTAVGGTTTPVYINASGVATALSYTIEKSVPSNAVFTDTTYDAIADSTINALFA